MPIVWLKDLPSPLNRHEVLNTYQEIHEKLIEGTMILELQRRTENGSHQAVIVPVSGIAMIAPDDQAA